LYFVNSDECIIGCKVSNFPQNGKEKQQKKHGSEENWTSQKKKLRKRLLNKLILCIFAAQYY
jgi:hypothetical protein